MRTSTNRRILLIDDMPSIHGDFRRILSGSEAASEMDASNGYVCFDLDSAYQGREGLAKVHASLAAENPYALAFVDMRTPGLGRGRDDPGDLGRRPRPL
jgi:two-component system, NtrC family, sensor kinase